ncbi:phosphonate metabolism protein/1,5-bisphosphokinase (PRPP-forming) PhnN [Roseospirillum parvum]|uniref:Ribose 1,5-bisphosphate phosphokinase PhnN n=1 Tax=Roseospirillum parvum TaxID=83401 RepID=A0A1G8B8A6_9PROT|nr:phosphonate metabolism protein/1,5-bisphosphokinase (PRPP-forming) PhnN [Roseospirillum parvum]SDH29408.1 ribose 1,5-bisphosphokinase [Roseospirillum parvum]
MPDTPSPRDTGRRTPGRLVYVVGPSGAGKDSLLGALAGRLETSGEKAPPITIAHRYITRPAGAGGEAHVALSPADFARRRAAGAFCLDWQSHGLSYGVGVEVESWLAGGLWVVVNGSRGHLAAALGRFPDLMLVVVRVAPAELKRRLLTRGRETAEEIAERLARADAFAVDHPGRVEIDNSGPLDRAADAFFSHLMQRMNKV